MNKLSLAAALLISAVAAPALAVVVAPVTVTQTTSGSAGNWTYNFTFTNNVSQGQRLYFFGLQDTSGTVTASPAGYSFYPGYSVNGTNYNLGWLTDSSGGIATGQSLGGFAIRDTATAAKSSFNFYGYTYNNGATYNAGGNVGGGTSSNPVFEFSSTGATAAVPEPATWAMMFLGFGGMGYALRRRPQAGARIRFA